MDRTVSTLLPARPLVPLAAVIVREMWGERGEERQGLSSIGLATVWKKVQRRREGRAGGGGEAKQQRGRKPSGFKGGRALGGTFLSAPKRNCRNRSVLDRPGRRPSVGRKREKGNGQSDVAARSTPSSAKPPPRPPNRWPTPALALHRRPHRPAVLGACPRGGRISPQLRRRLCSKFLALGSEL